jgi:hypothetical protein
VAAPVETDPRTPRSVPRRWTLTSGFDDVSAETAAYAAYVNAPRGVLDDDEQQLFDEDLAKARAAMERAWLEAKPVRDTT